MIPSQLVCNQPVVFSPRRPLHIAARKGLATVVQVLLSRGAAVMAVDEDGKAVIMIGWEKQSQKFTQELLLIIINCS